MLPSALLPAASKIQVHTILRFSIAGSKSVLEVISLGQHASKTATRTSLLWTWSIPERKSETGFRPRPHVSGYFWIRKFFFPDTKISLYTRSVFKSSSPVHTYPLVSGFTLVPKAPLQSNVFRACAVERDSCGEFALFALHVVPPYWFLV